MGAESVASAGAQAGGGYSGDRSGNVDRLRAGTVGGAEGFAHLEPLPDSRVIYSVHFYEPGIFTHQGVLDVEGLPLAEARKKAGVTYPGKINDEPWDKTRLAACLAPVDAFQARYHVPIYVGEFSVIRWAPEGSGARWLKDAIDLFEARHWSWTYHAFREWNGWSLEHDGEYWMNGMSPPPMAATETDRARVVRAALARNAASGAGALIGSPTEGPLVDQLGDDQFDAVQHLLCSGMPRGRWRARARPAPAAGIAPTQNADRDEVHAGLGSALMKPTVLNLTRHDRRRRLRDFAETSRVSQFETAHAYRARVAEGHLHDGGQRS